MATTTIGIRELKGRAPQVVREVRESGEAVDITYRGKVVARLVPVEVPASASDFTTAWKEFDAVARAIGKRSGRGALGVPRKWRRDL